jgi:hypothetical protein
MEYHRIGNKNDDVEADEEKQEIGDQGRHLADAWTRQVIGGTPGQAVSSLVIMMLNRYPVKAAGLLVD